MCPLGDETREAYMSPPELLPPPLARLGYVSRNRSGIQFILPPLCRVLAGQFLMGSEPQRDPNCQDDERPQTSIGSHSFHIGRFPVTVAEHACFVLAGHAPPHRTFPGNVLSDWPDQLERRTHPVVGVTWHDAVAYASWLDTHAEQHGWRLPTEAEWEKAARWDRRARRASLYPWGDTFEQSLCNSRGSGIDATTPVGAFAGGAAPSGAEDLAGNVSEWTSSLYRPYPYRADDGREGGAVVSPRYVCRGGSWDSYADEVRAAHRAPWLPSEPHELIGFRLAWAPS
jgi:formylglycine-generating enzyme required for sulfatase activity